MYCVRSLSICITIQPLKQNVKLRFSIWSVPKKNSGTSSSVPERVKEISDLLFGEFGDFLKGHPLSFFAEDAVDPVHEEFEALNTDAATVGVEGLPVSDHNEGGAFFKKFSEFSGPSVLTDEGVDFFFGAELSLSA